MRYDRPDYTVADENVAANTDYTNDLLVQIIDLLKRIEEKLDEHNRSD